MFRTIAIASLATGLLAFGAPQAEAGGCGYQSRAVSYSSSNCCQPTYQVHRVQRVQPSHGCYSYRPAQSGCSSCGSGHARYSSGYSSCGSCGAQSTSSYGYHPANRGYSSYYGGQRGYGYSPSYGRGYGGGSAYGRGSGGFGGSTISRGIGGFGGSTLGRGFGGFGGGSRFGGGW